ncbi:MAG: nitrate- and nitrite sensing domain-containing protein [Pseudonocardiaceae bacterium]
MTTQSFAAGPGFGMFGAGGAALRHRGGRWRLKDWRLRTKLTAVLLVPLLLAGVLGTLRVTELVGKARGFAALSDQIRFAQQLGVVVYELQGERYRVAALQASGGTADRAGVAAQGRRVDSAVGSLRAAPATGDTSTAAALSRLSGLPALRRATSRTDVAPGNVAARDAVFGYSALIATLLELDRRALDGTPDSVARQVDGVKVLAVAQEKAAYEHAALLAGIFSGGLFVDQQAMLRAADARFDAAAEEFGQAVSPGQQQLYFGARSVLDRKRLLATALDRAQRGAPLETVAGDWNSAAVGTVEDIRQGQITLLGKLRQDTVARSDRAWHEAFWDGAAVIALLLLAVALLIVVVRSLLQPLRALRTAAFEVADRRLPEAAEQLRSADSPGQTTVDPVPVHSREEVGQVARAFDTMHVQAVRLAAEQAQRRCSLNDVFVNLSGRTQQLLQRQLQLIDEVRSQTHDPAVTSNLVALDRLAARMRRHSENLLVLAGGTVRRGAEGPTAVLDVLTNALSEIDSYQRVTVCPSPPAMVTGPIANDLVHLIAELLDNATSVAPQGTMVTLASALTEEQSLLVEITDSGPGIALDELQEINARLASAPATDVSVPGQMGLLVVRELAAQHGISVRLRQRLGGDGITATVLLPPSLVTVDLRVPMDGAPTSTSERESWSPGWSGPEGQLPLQVSVIDEATEGELFSPASINPASLGVGTSQRSQPRTAQQDWLELFGSSDQAGDQVQVATATDALNSAAPLAGSLPPTAGAATGGPAEEVREEIFEMVSAWFREQQSAPVDDAPATAATEWWSPFDEGWQAAQALRAPVDHDFTTAGLPKRQPRAHLVPGADGDVLPTPVSAAPARTPDAVRGRLSRYQRGLNVGRHAHISPDEQLSWTDTLQRPFVERTFEENQ